MDGPRGTLFFDRLWKLRMSKVQKAKRRRGWPKPVCPVCGNPIEKMQDVVFEDRGATIRHTLCVPLDGYGASTSKREQGA